MLCKCRVSLDVASAARRSYRPITFALFFGQPRAWFSCDLQARLFPCAPVPIVPPRYLRDSRIIPGPAPFFLRGGRTRRRVHRENEQQRSEALTITEIRYDLRSIDSLRSQKPPSRKCRKSIITATPRRYVYSVCPVAGFSAARVSCTPNRVGRMR